MVETPDVQVEIPGQGEEDVRDVSSLPEGIVKYPPSNLSRALTRPFDMPLM